MSKNKHKRPLYADLHRMSEDDRIKTIGETAIRTGGVIAFCVDDEPGKANRYAKKLLEQFPQLAVIDQFKGPVAGVITIKVQKRSVVVSEEPT